MSKSWQLQSSEVVNAAEPESNKRSGKEIKMKFSDLKRVWAAIAFAIAAAPLLAATAYAGPSLNVHATFADNEITALEDNCDPSTGLPFTGDAACIGIETITGSFSGDLQGTYLSEIDFAVLANGEAPYSTFTTFSVTVAGHGSGSFTDFEVGSIAPSGEITGKWRVLNGSGTGELAGITGKGKVAGTYDPNTGLSTGPWSGVFHFAK
jgi:hypothetical protein